MAASVRQLTTSAPEPDAGATRRSLRVVAADPDPAVRSLCREALPALGHEVHAVATARQLLEVCRTASPDLIIADARLPDLAGSELAETVCRGHGVPVVLVADAPDRDGVWDAAGCPVLAYLARPVTAAALAAAVATAVRCSDQIRALREEASELRRALEDRKVIERAKGAVARRCGTTEDEAYHRIRRLATDGGRRLRDVAQQVLDAETVFSALDRLGPG